VGKWPTWCRDKPVVWFITFVTKCSEILRWIPTVETARTLGLCCLFSNSMQYSAKWDVLIAQVMYKLLSLTKLADSVSRSDCLAKATGVTFVNKTVLVLGLGLCLSNNKALFLWTLHFRFFNIKLEFNIIFPSV